MSHFELAGQRLEYVWHGPSPEAGPTLVFLHEGLGSVAMWGDYPAAVAGTTGCGALVYSRFGYGSSDRAKLQRSVRFMHEEALVVLPQVLQHFKIQKPILAGHSDGGSIALIYAGSNPSAVRGLVLEAPHVFTEELTIRSIEAASKNYKAGGLKQRLAKYHQNADHTFLGWTDVWLNPEFRFWTIEEFLPAIRCPMLLIQGLEDHYGTIKQIDAIKNACPALAETLLLPDCGHSPHRDQREQTLRATVEFILRACL